MSNQPNIKSVLNLYEANRSAIAKALRQAGGDPEVIFNNPGWKEVMATLAINSVAVSAEYLTGEVS